MLCRKRIVASFTLALFLVVSIVSPALGKSRVSRMDGVAVTSDGDLVGRASMDELAITPEGEDTVVRGILKIAGDTFEIEARLGRSDGTALVGSGYALNTNSEKKISVSLVSMVSKEMISGVLESSDSNVFFTVGKDSPSATELRKLYQSMKSGGSAGQVGITAVDGGGGDPNYRGGTVNGLGGMHVVGPYDIPKSSPATRYSVRTWADQGVIDSVSTDAIRLTKLNVYFTIETGLNYRPDGLEPNSTGASNPFTVAFQWVYQGLVNVSWALATSTLSTSLNGPNAEGHYPASTLSSLGFSTSDLSYTSQTDSSGTSVYLYLVNQGSAPVGHIFTNSMRANYTAYYPRTGLFSTLDLGSASFYTRAAQ